LPGATARAALQIEENQHERLTTRLAELRQAAGVVSDDDFERLAVAAANRKTLADEVANLRREIASNEEPESFRAELVQANTDALVLAGQQAKENLDTAEDNYRKAVEEEALAKSSRRPGRPRPCKRIGTRAESDRAELRDSVDRWAPLVLADAILAQAIARFEREHQPAMLRDVGQLFSKLTRARYVDLQRRLDEQGTFCSLRRPANIRNPAN